MDKYMFSALLFVIGWLWSYLFLRQFIFNFTVASPLIKAINASSPDLIAPTARKFLWVSILVNFIVCAIILIAVIFLCKVYMIVFFALGAVSALAMCIKKLTYKNKELFESFCTTYYRFIVDDELRTLMYNKKLSQMKVRLHAMNLDYSFIPKFSDN